MAGHGPSVPHFRNASPDLVAALAALDRPSDPAGSPSDQEGALTTLLDRAGRDDTLSLWHLLPRLEPPLRERLFDRILELVPRSQSVDRAAVLALDATALDTLRMILKVFW